MSYSCFVAFVSSTASAFEVVDVPRWAERVVLERGAGTWQIDQGLVFPVVDAEGETETIGFVVVGLGRASFSFDGDGEALRFASTLAEAGEPLEVARAALDGSWAEPFDLVLSLGSHAGDAAVWALPPARLDGDVVSYLAPDGQEQVVVTDYRFGNALAAAKEVVRSRIPALARAGVDPALARKLEAYDPAGRWVGEVHGTRRWTPFLEPAFRTFDDRWLSFSSDPTGSVDPERRDVVFVHGVGEGDQPRWATLTGSGTPRDELRVERGVANLVFEREGTGVAADVEFEAILTVRSGAQQARLVPLALPSRESAEIPGQAALSSQLEVGVASADGPLERIGRLYGPSQTRSHTDATWLLPQTLAAGGTAKLQVKWRDRWRISHLVDLRAWFTTEARLPCSQNPPEPCIGPEGVPEWAQLGQVTYELVWPSIGARLRGYPTELRVGTTNPRWSAAVGAMVTEEQRGDGTWWITQGSSRGALTFGELELVTVPAARGFPAIRSSGQPGMVGRDA